MEVISIDVPYRIFGAENPQPCVVPSVAEIVETNLWDPFTTSVRGSDVERTIGANAETSVEELDVTVRRVPDALLDRAGTIYDAGHIPVGVLK